MDAIKRGGHLTLTGIAHIKIVVDARTWGTFLDISYKFVFPRELCSHLMTLPEAKVHFVAVSTPVQFLSTLGIMSNSNASLWENLSIQSVSESHLTVIDMVALVMSPHSIQKSLRAAKGSLRLS